MGKRFNPEIVSKVREFLDNDDWNYSFDEERGLFRFNLNVDSKLRKLNYIIDVKDDEYLVYGILPVGGDKDDDEMMTNLAKFVCCANYGLKNGSFELDFNDGEVRFKTYVDCDEQLPGNRVIRNSIYCVAAMVEHYAAGFIEVVFMGADGVAAAEKCD